jgi:DNA repair photolyase
LSRTGQLVGIARLATEGHTLEDKRRVQYRSLPTRKWLNRCRSTRVPFDYTINPYRGCEFGCKYCYARFTHEFMERHQPDAFETEIYAKDLDVGSFRRELAFVKPGRVIGLGTATDPYQPAEHRFGRTRQILEAMTMLRETSLYLTTKSSLAARDAGLLKRISEYNRVVVTVSLITLDCDLARLVEPYAPHPDLRLSVVRELSSAGVSVGVIASPVLPLLTDSEENLRSVAMAAKRAGAECFFAGVLFLKPAAQRVFFPFLEQRFPEHLRRYEMNYRAGAYLRGEYPARIAQLVCRIRERTGLASRAIRYVQPGTPPHGQLSLF